VDFLLYTQKMLCRAKNIFFSIGIGIGIGLWISTLILNHQNRLFREKQGILETKVNVPKHQIHIEPFTRL
jgi:hypothetical protein